MSGKCLENVSKMSGICLENVSKMSGRGVKAKSRIVGLRLDFEITHSMLSEEPHKSKISTIISNHLNSNITNGRRVI